MFKYGNNGQFPLKSSHNTQSEYHNSFTKPSKLIDENKFLRIPEKQNYPTNGPCVSLMQPSKKSTPSNSLSESPNLTDDVDAFKNNANHENSSYLENFERIGSFQGFYDPYSSNSANIAQKNKMAAGNNLQSTAKGFGISYSGEHQNEKITFIVSEDNQVLLKEMEDDQKRIESSLMKNKLKFKEKLKEVYALLVIMILNI